MHKYFKTIVSTFTVIIFLALAFGSSETNDNETQDTKTGFSSREELKEYLGWSDSGQHTYKMFSELRNQWGDGNIKISKIYCNSNKCYVNVLFEKVSVDGSSVWLIFEANEFGNPFGWCTGYDFEKITETPNIQLN